MYYPFLLKKNPNKRLLRKKTCHVHIAIKRVRTSENANVKNSSQTSAMRTAIKKFEDAVASGADNVDALYKEAVKAIDMAESKGLIHKNKANRDKSRLSKKIAK